MRQEEQVILPKGIAPIGKVRTAEETRIEAEKAKEALKEVFKIHYQGIYYVQETK